MRREMKKVVTINNRDQLDGKDLEEAFISVKELDMGPIFTMVASTDRLPARRIS